MRGSTNKRKCLLRHDAFEKRFIFRSENTILKVAFGKSFFFWNCLSCTVLGGKITAGFVNMNAEWLGWEGNYCLPMHLYFGELHCLWKISCHKSLRGFLEKDSSECRSMLLGTFPEYWALTRGGWLWLWFICAFRAQRIISLSLSFFLFAETNHRKERCFLTQTCQLDSISFCGVANFPRNLWTQMDCMMNRRVFFV